MSNLKKILTDVDYETAHISLFLLVQGFIGVTFALVLDEGETILKKC